MRNVSILFLFLWYTILEHTFGIERGSYGQIYLALRVSADRRSAAGDRGTGTGI